MTRTIGFLAFPAFELLDLTGPLDAFHVAERMMPGSYQLVVMAPGGGAVTSSVGLDIIAEPADNRSLDTLVVAGGPVETGSEAPGDVVAYVRDTAARVRRIASVCTGAFILAEAGLLDARRATTHWSLAALLQARHPRVKVDGDRIFIEDGPIWTSAGITAGIDLALALIEADLGAEAARTVARQLVVYHRRPGGQSQFSALLEMEPASDRIRRTMGFARDHLHESLPVERLAEIASLSPRQFGRVFLAETGMTPARAIERLRAEAARPRVEDGIETLEVIARAVGFGDPERMRQSFIRAFGHPPQALRRTARADDRVKFMS